MGEMISIIVPVYNVFPYIIDCINSIISQSYEKIELIIVDDGSTDESSCFLDLISNNIYSNIIIMVIHKKNEGVTNSRLLGVKASLGDYIGFVDGDDVIENEMYNVLYNNMIKYNADISHCGYKIIVDNGSRIHYFYNSNKLKLQDKNTGIFDLIKGKIIEPGVWNKLYSRKLFNGILQNNIIDASIQYREDYLMNYYLFKQANLSVFEDVCLYRYVSRKDSVSRKGFSAKRYFDTIKVDNIILEDIRDGFGNLALTNYLSSCMLAYKTSYSIEEYKKEAIEIKGLLIRHKKNWRFLCAKERIKMYLILYFPYLYKIIYAFYSAYIKKTIYE